MEYPRIKVVEAFGFEDVDFLTQLGLFLFLSISFSSNTLKRL